MQRTAPRLALGGIAVILLAASALSTAALAEKVGVAAHVKPEAFSGGEQIKIGNSVFYNQRINTDSAGLVQVLLVDGSTFTVGPGSDLVIDSFVYDPKKQRGQVVATFSKGVMRFVGGKISKNEGGVTVNTPSGALAIRGGMFNASYGNGRDVFAFLYGVQMSFKGTDGETHNIFEPGYVLDLTSGTPNVRQATPEDVQFFMQSLSGGGYAVGGGTTNVQNQNNTNNDNKTDQLNNQANNITSNATTDQNLNTIQKQEQGTITARVLAAPGVYTAFPGTSHGYTTDRGAEQGILGGGDYPQGATDPFADDFQWTFRIINGRVVGTVSGLTDAHCNEGDCDDIVTKRIAQAQVNFPWTFSSEQCAAGVCFVSDATVAQNNEITNYIGLAVLRPDFFAYHVAAGQIVDNTLQFAEDTEPLLIFGGKAHNFGTPSGKVYLFALTPDVLQGTYAPFASAKSTPIGGIDDAVVTPLVLLTKDSNDNSRTVWLQTSFYIGSYEYGSEQDSFINVALGGMSDQGGLIGARRGGSHLDVIDDYGCEGPCESTRREAFAFTGDIATLAGPGGLHFLGKDQPNIVIGIDSTGTHNIGRDLPLDPDDSSPENESGATYHIGVGLGSLDTQLLRSGGSFQGYAAGLVQSEQPVSNFLNIVASESLEDFSLAFDRIANTLTASLTVRDMRGGDGAVDAYNFVFGGEGRSAYIDDEHYAAIESTEGNSVVHNNNQNYQNTSATSYLVSGEQLGVTKFFPGTFGPTAENGPPPAFCNHCEFLRWGAWGTRVNFDNGASQHPHYVDNIHLGWWVAGDVAANADLPDTGSATYNGHVIGNVANNIDSQGWRTYVATGDMTMTWVFAERSGQLNITNFDQASFGANGLTFSGQMSAPGQVAGDFNSFSGIIAGALPDQTQLTGGAAGSFVKPIDANGYPKGVIGNWNVGSQAYKATGIFAGSGVPNLD